MNSGIFHYSIQDKPFFSGRRVGTLKRNELEHSKLQWVSHLPPVRWEREIRSRKFGSRNSENSWLRYHRTRWSCFCPNRHQFISTPCRVKVMFTKKVLRSTPKHISDLLYSCTKTIMWPFRKTSKLWHGGTLIGATTQRNRLQLVVDVSSFFLKFSINSQSCMHCLNKVLGGDTPWGA